MYMGLWRCVGHPVSVPRPEVPLAAPRCARAPRSALRSASHGPSGTPCPCRQSVDGGTLTNDGAPKPVHIGGWLRTSTSTGNGVGRARADAEASKDGVEELHGWPWRLGAPSSVPAPEASTPPYAPFLPRPRCLRYGVARGWSSRQAIIAGRRVAGQHRSRDGGPPRLVPGLDLRFTAGAGRAPRADGTKGAGERVRRAACGCDRACRAGSGWLPLSPGTPR